MAFGLLALIGGNMIREALGPEEEEAACAGGERLDLRRLLLMAVATSIDALAVGVTTFCLSLAGVAVGNFFGTRYKKRAELSGGVILILLGAKILLEHLGIL